MDDEASAPLVSTELEEDKKEEALECSETDALIELPELTSTCTLTLEQATEQISPAIHKVLLEKFNGTLEKVRPVNIEDHLF